MPASARFGAESFQSWLPDLEQRSLAENFYWAICRKILNIAKELDYFPKNSKAARLLADTYFCNFSLFQSMPDSWAVKQLSPSCRSIAWTNPHAPRGTR